MSETGDPGPPSGAEGGGGGSFWTSGPGLLTAAATLFTAIVSGVVALHNAGILGDDDGGSTTAAGSTGETAETETTSISSLFREVTRPLGRVYFEGETMYVKSEEPRRRMVALAEGEEALEDVGVSVRAGWVGGARDFGLGLICRYENADNYYLLSLLSGGRYNILRYRGGRAISLRRGSHGATAGDVNDIAIRCVGNDPASLTLTVDGRTVATAKDPDGIRAGSVGVRVGSDESWVTCRFDGFDLRSL